MHAMSDVVRAGRDLCATACLSTHSSCRDAGVRSSAVLCEIRHLDFSADSGVFFVRTPRRGSTEHPRQSERVGEDIVTLDVWASGVTARSSAVP